MEKAYGAIKQELQAAEISMLPVFIRTYETDSRKGVISLVESAKKKLEKYEKEVQRMEQMKVYERQYWKEGYVCGIDEVGRGPLAGPVVACAVVLPEDWNVLYVNDSKKLSEKMREELYDRILETAISVGIGFRDEKRIDEINILQATYEAMREAVSKLSVKPDVFLNDAVTIPGITGKQIPIIKGDAKSASIAAASIVAKVTRDRFMVQMDEKYPGYGFSDNKGYGSAAHIDGIKKLGLCPIHRRSFTKNFMI